MKKPKNKKLRFTPDELHVIQSCLKVALHSPAATPALKRHALRLWGRLDGEERT